ncbi:MAG: hypothetical protein JWO31_2468 [Phycisphaerales bacterium]|nr:hypothetical protein [Phycisphaerales bacterium]
MPTALMTAAPVARTAYAFPAAAGPLMLDRAAAARRRGLTGGRTPRDLDRQDGAVAPTEAARLARLAATDRRSTHDRVLDRVADGLMAELGWR